MNIVGFSYFLFIILSFVLSIFFNFNSRQYKLLLCLLSYYFYATFDIIFCFLLFFVTIVNFALSYLIGINNNNFIKKIILYGVLIFDIGILFIFKYMNFFVGSVAGDLSDSVILSSITALVPVGISFFIFQALTYPLDVYRGTCQPTRSFLDFTFFLVFFLSFCQVRSSGRPISCLS